VDAEEVESVFGRPIRRNKRINKLLNEGRLPYVQLAGPGRESDPFPRLVPKSIPNPWVAKRWPKIVGYAARTQMPS